MPDFGGKHYMNPAYGRTILGFPEAERSGPSESNGALEHVSIHPQKDGGYAVHAHFDHPRAGHHTVDSKHADHEEAVERVKEHLRAHEATKGSAGSGAQNGEDTSAT
jgi:hypothetical protein